MNVPLPRGFRVSGVHCGIKSDPAKEDLTLIVTDEPAVAAGVYTQNTMFAAPVALDRERTPNDRTRVVVANSGNANACTGSRGLRDAGAMAQHAARHCGVEPEQALVLSTGVIGEFLPLDKIEAGIADAAASLGRDGQHLTAAARGLMTTDTVKKLSARTLQLTGGPVQLTGMAKGAAMIGPRMATMLAVIFTDARLAVEDAQAWLARAVDESFNCLSIDGHMSTNDTVLFLASGSAGGPAVDGTDAEAVRAALTEVCIDLARAIADDGEGATHLITIDVLDAATREAAHGVAKTVAESPLVKTAIAGADPNWGRIVSAAGYAPWPASPERVQLEVNGHVLYKNGSPAAFDAEAVSASIRDHRETSLVLRLGEGEAHVRFWTTDLTAEYVRLNADYHT